MKSYIAKPQDKISFRGLIRISSVLLLLIFAGCTSLDLPIIGSSEDKDTDPEEEPSTSLVGNWEWLESSQGEGTTVGDPSSMQIPGENDMRLQQFNSNGTYIWQQVNANGDVLLTDAGTWRVENSDLIYNEETFPAIYQYEVVNNQLTLTRISIDGEFGYWLQEKWQRQ